MTRVRMLCLRFLSLFRKGRLERELEAEIQSHLAMQAEDHVRRGIAVDSVDAEARRSFGPIGPVKEHYRDLRGVPAIETVIQDLRHGCRVLAANPLFAFIAVVSLAIGIGANTATFSLADTILLRPLPVPRAAEIVTVGSKNTAASSQFAPLRSSYPDYTDLRDHARSLSGLAATLIVQVPTRLSGQGESQVRTAMIVSGNYFGVMDIQPAVGRFFLSEDDALPLGSPVVVLSHGYWQRQFGGNPGVLGQVMRLRDTDFVVIGVGPESFTGSDQFARPDFYVPTMMWPALVSDPPTSPFEQRDRRSLTLKGRLAAGVSVEEARAEMNLMGRGLAADHPDTNEHYEVLLRTEIEERLQTNAGIGPLVAMLGALSCAVLLAACSNVAGLLGSRAPRRSREIALRLSIGAHRHRVVRQLVTENLVLAFLGGLAALGVGYAGIRLWGQMQFASTIPFDLNFVLDRRALLVSFSVAVASVFLFGLAPAVHMARRSSISGVLRNAGGHRGHRRPWGRRVLVSGQVAVSLALLSVAGFMYASFQRQLALGPGFRTDHVLAMSFDPSLSGYALDQSMQFYRELIEGAENVPGVEAVALASFVPMAGLATSTTLLRPEGYEFSPGIEAASVLTSHVSDEYFETMAVPVIEGRAFRETDTLETPMVAIVNEELAHQYWPGQSPVGRRFRIVDGEGPWVEVVGVVPTGRYFSTVEPRQQFLYLPSSQHPRTRMSLLVHSRDESTAMVAPLRDMVLALDGDMAVVQTQTMESLYFDMAIGNLVVVIRAVGGMGLMGVILAFVGLYGLVSYNVSARTREIGIRTAVGASRASVVRMVLGQGLWVAGTGIVVGLFLTFGADRGMRIAFPGGGGTDRHPVEYLVWIMVLLAITGVASYLPARRAATVSPTVALREE